MYLSEPQENWWILDIEGDPIPSTRIWCVVAKNVVSGKFFKETDPEKIKTFIDLVVSKKGVFIGHNLIGYDAPTLNRLLGTKITIKNIIDTMLLSMLYSPSLNGGHSLDSWGKRLGDHKQEFSDFSKFTPEMLEYCTQDVKVTFKTFMTLRRLLIKHGYSEEGIEVEHRSWQLIQRQQINGFHFDEKRAQLLYAELRGIEKNIEREILEIYPPEVELLRVYKGARKKDGEFSANYLRLKDQYERVEINEDTNEFSCYGINPFNIGSPLQRTEKLLGMGWKPGPDEMTKTGLPQPFVNGKLAKTLEDFVEKSGLKGPSLIANWIEINSRANMINTWIEAYNEKTGCIHGRLWLANTLRYRHSEPNTANIPAVRLDKDKKPKLGLGGRFTYEARDLWECRDPTNRSLVGVDAKGIQLRVLAHYLNNPVFTEAVVSGDPHSYNQEIGGFATRDIAKTFILTNV